MGSQFVDFCYKFTGFGLFFDNYWRCTCVNHKNNNNNKNGLTLSLPECLMEFCKVNLTCESVDEILWCGHSNESSLPVLTHGAICFTKFYKMKFKNLVEICLCLHLAVKGLKLLSICLHWGSSIYSCVRLIYYILSTQINRSLRSTKAWHFFTETKQISFGI